MRLEEYLSESIKHQRYKNRKRQYAQDLDLEPGDRVRLITIEELEEMCVEVSDGNLRFVGPKDDPLPEEEWLFVNKRMLPLFGTDIVVGTSEMKLDDLNKEYHRFVMKGQFNGYQWAFHYAMVDLLL